MTEKKFSGFPQAGLRFLSDLGDNNNREWFQAHEEDYQKNIIAPAVAFVETIGPQLQFLSPGIYFDTRTNGQGSLMRIYRDVRFSKDKSPYKTWVGIRFWEGAGKASGNPGFFFGFDASGGGLHVGMHGFDKNMLAAYREAVDDEAMGTELEEALNEVRKAGAYEIKGEHYKRVPRGYDADHPRADLLRFNTLYASSPVIEPVVLASSILVDVVIDHCEKMSPVQGWITKVKQGLGS